MKMYNNICIIGEEFPRWDDDKSEKSLDSNNVKEFIEKLFPKGDDKSEKSSDNKNVKRDMESILKPGDNNNSKKSILTKTAIYAIYESHNFVRKKYGKSSVS